jgi:hypothetical protein
MSQGADDKLVPASCNQDFYDAIKVISPFVVFRVFPKVKHEVTETLSVSNSLILIMKNYYFVCHTQ